MNKLNFDPGHTFLQSDIPQGSLQTYDVEMCIHFTVLNNHLMLLKVDCLELMLLGSSRPFDLVLEENGLLNSYES